MALKITEDRMGEACGTRRDSKKGRKCKYRGADKSLARPGRKQATATKL